MHALDPETFRKEVSRHRDELLALVNRDGNLSVCPEALTAVAIAHTSLVTALEKLAVQQARSNIPRNSLV